MVLSAATVEGTADYRRQRRQSVIPNDGPQRHLAPLEFTGETQIDQRRKSAYLVARATRQAHGGIHGASGGHHIIDQQHAAARMKPRDSMPATASVALHSRSSNRPSSASSVAAKCVRSSGVKSRNRIPARGKSGTSTMWRLRSCISPPATSLAAAVSS